MITRLRQLFRRKFIQDTLALQTARIGMTILSLISSVLVWRLMGPQAFGIYTLAQGFQVIWATFDMTGIGTSTRNNLALAIGARDKAAILDLMGLYVKVSLLVSLFILLLIALFGPLSARLVYNGDPRIGTLALWLQVGVVADGLYGLVLIALQSRRSMRALAGLQAANQFVLTSAMIGAVLISPTPESLVAGRVFYSYFTLIMAVIVYLRLRGDYPTLRAIAARAVTVSPRLHWRFGVANAIDKNISELFSQLPLQLVGALIGARAVGYLSLAMSGIGQAGVLTTAVLDNMQAVVPQAVGRGDFVGLWRNFRRVLLVLALAAVVIYGGMALVAPLLIVPVLGTRWIPALVPLAVLTLYGGITTVGGIFGPLYRAFNLMRPAITVKLITLALILPPSLWLFERLAAPVSSSTAFFGAARLIPFDLLTGQAGAVGGALLIDTLFLLSVALTALVTLPELKKRADHRVE